MADTSAAATRRRCPQIAFVSPTDLDVPVCFGDEDRYSQNSGCSCGICPRILRLEPLVKKQQCTGLGCGQARGVDEPAILREPLGLERQATVGKSLLPLSDFLAAEERANDLESPSSQTLETTAPSGRLDRPDCGYVQSTVAAVLTVIMFETGTVRSKTGGAEVTISLNFRSMSVNRASSQEISARTTFVIDFFQQRHRISIVF